MPACLELKCPPASLNSCAIALALPLAMAGPSPVSAAQPTYPKGFLPLSQLTSRSARMGKWQLAVFHAWEDEYQYDWEGDKKRLLLQVPSCRHSGTDNVLQCGVQKTKSNTKGYEAALKNTLKEASAPFKKSVSLTLSRHNIKLHRNAKSSIWRARLRLQPSETPKPKQVLYSLVLQDLLLTRRNSESKRASISRPW